MTIIELLKYLFKYVDISKTLEFNIKEMQC